MAIQVERMVAILEARLDKYEKGLAKARGQTDRQFTAIERRGKQMESRLSSLGANFSRGFLGALAGAASIRGAQQLIDAATRIQNALKVAGLSGEELTKVYDRLFESAQKNAVPLEAMVTLYGRVAQAQDALNVSQEEMTNFTDKIGVALRVSGASATEAAGALLQLSQALGAGIVRAEEYNSINEGARPILQAVAAGLKEAGGDVAKLRNLVMDGAVSSEAFFRAFEAGSVILEEKVAGSELTVSQAFVRLQNVLVDTAGKFDDSVDASGNLARFMENTLIPAIQELGGVFNWLGTGPVAQFIGYINDATDAILQMSADLGAATGLDEIGRKFGAKPYIGQPRIQSRIDDAFAGTAAPKGPRKPLELTVDKGTVVNPVSLSDYAAPTKAGKGRGGRGPREESFEREIRQIKERTAAIQAETAAMMGLNPLIEDYGYTLEKARAKQDLLTAAKRAGIAVTPQLEAQIEQLAEGYAQASVAAEQLAESQDKARQAAEEMRDLGKDVMSGLVNDLVEGKSAADAFATALKKIGDKLLDMAFDGLFSGMFKGGSSGGGLFGGAIIPGILHSGGVAGRDGYGHGRAVSPSVFAGAKRYHKGGIAGLQPGEVPAILQRGEVVIPKGGAVGGGMSVNITLSPVIDNRGASVEAVARTQQQLDKLKAELPAHVTAAVRKAQKSNVKLG